MKVLLLAALIAVAAAKPGLVQPGPAGPVPAPNPEDAFHPIAIGPAIIDSFEPIAIGPAIVEEPIVGEPIAVGPAVVESPAVPSSPSPLVQIILNVNTAASAPVKPVRPVPFPTEPVQVVETAPVPAEPVQVVEVAPVPIEPVDIAVPIIPQPVNIPEELN